MNEQNNSKLGAASIQPELPRQGLAGGVHRNYKDRLFRMVFREKKELLSLYNAVNGTDYTNPNDLEIVTLENAIYLNMKNDLAFVMDFYLSLYEQQSTFCPNMPLRNLQYIARELEVWLKGRSIYVNSLVKIPTPRFVVFYNGKEDMPERMTLKLSDAFIQPVEEPELELKVLMLNINPGKNEELLGRCRTLKEYMQYVEKVRTYAAEMELSKAVERSVEECIAGDILSEFLIKYRREAIQMSIFEYDEEETIRQIRQDEFAQGWKAGKEEGKSEGRAEGKAEGNAEGRLQGKSEGKIEGILEGMLEAKREDILEILEERGAVDETLRSRISGQADLEVLRQWHRFAAKAESVEEFSEKVMATA